MSGCQVSRQPPPKVGPRCRAPWNADRKFRGKLKPITPPFLMESSLVFLRAANKGPLKENGFGRVGPQSFFLEITTIGHEALFRNAEYLRSTIFQRLVSIGMAIGR